MFERRHYNKLAEYWREQLTHFDGMEDAYVAFKNMLKSVDHNFNEERFDAASGYTE